MNRGTGVPRRSGLLALNLNGSRASFDAQAGHRAATPGFPGAKLLTEGHRVHGWIFVGKSTGTGWWLSPTPLKNMSSSDWIIIPTLGENKKCSKPPTGENWGGLHVFYPPYRKKPMAFRLLVSLPSNQINWIWNHPCWDLPIPVWSNIYFWYPMFLIVCCPNTLKPPKPFRVLQPRYWLRWVWIILFSNIAQIQ